MKLEIEISRRALYALATASAVGLAAIYGLRAHAEPMPPVPADVSSGDTLTAAMLNQQLAATRALVNQIGDPKCPLGYTQDTTLTTFVDCKKGSDEVVKVGSGGAAFWIDRYEASVWSDAAATATQYGKTGDDYPGTFAKNGQWTVPLYAVSKTGVPPSASLTWFQAIEACGTSGKRLPDGQEWLRAARGTTDGSGCNVSTTVARNTGGGATCRSSSGAEDMIGNVWEWTNEWYAGLGNATTSLTWPDATYNGDGMWNITSSAYHSAAPVVGLPGAALRGGSLGNGSRAGLFALFLENAPSYWVTTLGFRCLLPR